MKGRWQMDRLDIITWMQLKGLGWTEEPPGQEYSQEREACLGNHFRVFNP